MLCQQGKEEERQSFPAKTATVNVSTGNSPFSLSLNTDIPPPKKKKSLKETQK